MFDAKVKTLLSVIETGSYTKAAEKLNLTQPAVSHQIRMLENEFDIKIFYRDKNKLKLTPQGKILVQYARRAAAVYTNACQAIEDSKSETRHLNVGISTTIQRETKLFLGADNEETAELTVPMYDFGDWASRMKAYRKKNHITQQELAQLMGVKHFTLRSWEQKQAKPPYNVWRLHKHLFDDSIKLT